MKKKDTHDEDYDRWGSAPGAIKITKKPTKKGTKKGNKPKK